MKKSGTLFAKMGLSSLSELQQQYPTFKGDRYYYMRYLGDNLTIFRQSVREPKRKEMSERSLANLEKKSYLGILSKKVRHKIITICSTWLTAIESLNEIAKNESNGKKRVLNMLTLTLASHQIHDDREIKRKLLMPFMQKLSRSYGHFNYLWRAEKQKNGNIHFHILLDIYIDKNEVRYIWNEVQDFLGYIKRYKETNPKFDAPSTKIECCTSKSSAINYVAKYISKDDCEIPVKGRLWGCNRALKDIEVVDYKINQDELLKVVSNACIGAIATWHNEQSIIIKRVTQSNEVTEILGANVPAKRINARNCQRLYQHGELFKQYHGINDWERDVVEEYGEIMSRYLFDNHMFGEIDKYIDNYI